LRKHRLYGLLSDIFQIHIAEFNLFQVLTVQVVVSSAGKLISADSPQAFRLTCSRANRTAREPAFIAIGLNSSQSACRRKIEGRSWHCQHPVPQISLDQE
jgi:hypothetical protein